MKNMTAKRWLLIGIVVVLAATGLVYYFTVIREASLPEKSEKHVLLLEDAEIIEIHGRVLEVMRNGKRESIVIRPWTEIYDQHAMPVYRRDLSVGQHISAIVENEVQHEPWNKYVTCYQIFTR